jgi:hypothetical protein
MCAPRFESEINQNILLVVDDVSSVNSESYVMT